MMEQHFLRHLSFGTSPPHKFNIIVQFYSARKLSKLKKSLKVIKNISWITIKII